MELFSRACSSVLTLKYRTARFLIVIIGCTFYAAAAQAFSFLRDARNISMQRFANCCIRSCVAIGWPSFSFDGWERPASLLPVELGMSLKSFLCLVFL